jgi:signal transduction histidine kinase
MTVRTQLLLTFSLVTILMAGPAMYGVTRLAELRDIAFSLRGGHAEAIHTVGQLQADLMEFDRSIRSYISFGAPEQLVGMAVSLQRAATHKARLRAYDSSAGASEDWLADLNRAAEEVQLLVSGDELAAATGYLEQVRPMLAEANLSLSMIAQAIDREGAVEVAQAQRISAAATRTTLLGMSIALALALALAGWTTKALTSPLRRLRDGMATVADGHFAPPPELPYGRRNEIGDLSRSFRAMAWRLAELDRLKAEFVSVIGHDLKTPLNIITGYADLVEEGSYGEMSRDQQEMLGVILDQTRLLTRLANQLLNLSKIEAGGFRIRHAEVEVAHFLSVIRRSFVPLAARKSIDFSMKVDPDSPDTILADAECLQNEVLGNLLTNAFKFTPPGGRVLLSIHPDPGGIRITVSDTGIGIPQDHLPFIFEKYYRVGKDARGDGSGLGLAIAREVVTAHGGSIQAASNPDEGTSISFVLPVRAQVEEVDEEPVVAAEV